METTNLKNKIQKEVEINMIDYLSHAKTAIAFINEVVSPLTSVSEEQEQAIGDILCLTQQEWEEAECDAEGPNKEQDAALDKIIEDAAAAISELF